MEFYHAKLTFSEELFIEKTYEQKELILKTLLSKKVLQHKKNQFVFIDVVTEDIEGQEFIYGKLAKYADIEELTVDTETQKTQSVVVEDKIIAKCHFVIELSEKILFYTEVSNHINNISFIEKFNDLMELGLIDTGYKIEARAINEIYTFFNRLEELKEIISIDLTIVPTNPNPIEIIQGVDAKLKLQNLKEKTIRYKGKIGGIKLDEEIKTNSIYTDVGYGTGRAVGIDKNNKRVRVFSKKSQRQKTDQVDIDDVSGYGIMKKIQSKIDGLKKSNNET